MFLPRYEKVKRETNKINDLPYTAANFLLTFAKTATNRTHCPFLIDMLGESSD